MDTYIISFLAAVAALYIPVFGWCWWQDRNLIVPLPTKETRRENQRNH